MRGGLGFALVMAPSPFVVPPAHNPPMRHYGRVQRWTGKGNTAAPREPPRAGGWVRNPPRGYVDAMLRTPISSQTIGGDGSRQCQVNPKIQANSGAAMAGSAHPGRIGSPACAL